MALCEGSQNDDIVVGDRFQMSIAQYNKIGSMGKTLMVRVKEILLNPDGTKQMIVEHTYERE